MLKDKPYSGIYENIDYCRKELLLARELFCNKNITEKQFNAMLKGLKLLILYCPEEIKTLAKGTLMEAVYRKKYYLPLWRQ